MWWQSVRYFLKSFFYGVASYCIFFTFDVYFVMPYSKKYETLNLTCVSFWIALVTISTFAYYTTKMPREKGSEYDYQNGKLIFKKDDENQNQAEE